MQLVTKTTLLVIVALLFDTPIDVSMLMDTAAAVEVTGASPALLPMPGQATRTASVEPAGPEVPPPSPDCFILGSRSFSIPFTVDASGTQPTEVHLYVSRGAGDAWKLLDLKRPDVAVKQFKFTADADGEYWFATRTIDTQGRRHPAGEIESQLKVYVDTAEPIVTLNADADAAGRVDAVFAINDATPVKKMQLRYVTDNVGHWQNVEIKEVSAGGKLQFTPPDEWKQLSLQFVATDTPGNQSVVTHLLRRPRLAEVPGSRYAAAPMTDSTEAHSAPYRIDSLGRVNAQAAAGPVIQLDRHQPQRAPSGVAAAHGYAPESDRGNESALDAFRGAAFPSRQSAPVTSAPPQFTPPPELFPPAQSSPSAPSNVPFAPPSVRGTPSPSINQYVQEKIPPAATAENVGNGFGLNSPMQASPKTSPIPTAPPAGPSQARTPAEAMRPLSQQSAVPPAGGSDRGTPKGSAGNFGLPNTTPEELPTPTPKRDTTAKRYESRRPFDSAITTGRTPVRYSDSERFSLDYELEAVGSQGVEAIELYGSTDGNTWDLWGRDPDRISPFDIETKEQGVFGFRIVVVGQNGLASPRPLAGETPDIVVVVDGTKPTVRITGAQYGEGDRIGALVIQYECDDANLMKRPVALSFSDNPQGPWTTIAAGLRNDGDYVWPADPQLPRQLYLRIDVTDQAGNVGTYILDQPIDSQGLAPRARIRGFQPLSGPVSTGEAPSAALPSMPGEQTAIRPRAAFK